MTALIKACAFAGLLVAGTAMASPPESRLQIRFRDSATGCAIQPEVAAHPLRPGAAEKRFGSALVAAHGRGAFMLEQGAHSLTVTSPRYHGLTAPLQVRDANPYQIEVLLDPLELPRELQLEDIAARHRDGFALIQGFIVDDDSGQPLHHVRVKAAPSGVDAFTDTRGFFQLYVPVQDENEQQIAPASLMFDKPGFRSEERRFVELWSRGDWTYQIRLNHGAGVRIVDERTERRQELREKETVVQPAAGFLIQPQVQKQVDDSAQLLPVAPAGIPSSSSPTIRVPTNVRVQDDTNIYYVTMNFYCKHVLPHEWIASWSSNSLNAGSLAVRCYAIARINGRAPTSDFDICGDSGCQNFKFTSSSSSTDKAVDFTDGLVLVNSSGVIPSTEYSAENNSLDKDCGDGFTAPTEGCLYDPICIGHARSGHGRGMCQRGSNRWDSTGNGYPVRDWLWILQHYYPALTLVKGTPLAIGDNVKSRSSDCDVRACAGGSISNGISCALLASKAPGQTGVILGGPLVVTNDGKGFTWFQVRWNDAGSTLGWSCENYLERVFSFPGAPTNLVVIGSATNRIDLNWNDSSDVETGFSIERAPAATGPWLEIATVDANILFFSDKKVLPGSSWFYRVRAYNAAGFSAYTGTASAITPNAGAPSLAPIPNRAVTPGTLITFTNTASAPDRAQLLTDFEPFLSETANGVVLFRTPNFSSSTSNFLDRAPEMDLAAVTDTYPTPGHGTGTVLYVHCNFTNTANPWLRLTTADTAAFRNPVIDFTKKLSFDIYSDKAIKVAAGCRETTTAAGTVIGADGGTSGSSIEWAGVTNISGTAPAPTRLVTSNTWTTLTFNFPNEPIRSFSSGNGVLSTTSGLGVLEHLAIVPAAGTGVYNFYLDNFAVLIPRVFTYSLGAGAPTNATLNSASGVFAWTPSAGQSPSTNTISVIVADNSSPPLYATNTFSVIVNNTVGNSPPSLSPISNRVVVARTTLTFTNTASDPNPADTLAFSLEPGAPASASINAATGVFTWTTVDSDTNSIHAITVRVTDSGSPPMSATAGFSVTVLPSPPPNHAPLLFPIDNRTTNVGSTVTFTNLAFDEDTQDTLTFSLDPGAPPGASIQPVTGVFHWVPTDADSNATRYITVRVTDNGAPPKSASATFSVTVLPKLPNNPPTLAAVPDRTVHAGTTVTVTNTASDPDADTLSFDLDYGAPATAAIDVATGIFTWTPSDAASNTTNHITVIATDDGEPSLSVSNSYNIVVRSRPVLHILSVTGSGVSLSWSAIPNLKYRLLHKTALSAPIWDAVTPDLTATNSTVLQFSNTPLAGATNQFFQVLVVP